MLCMRKSGEAHEARCVAPGAGGWRAAWFPAYLSGRLWEPIRQELNDQGWQVRREMKRIYLYVCPKTT